MKKTIIIFSILMSVMMAIADDYLVFWLNVNSSSSDKATIKSGLKTLLNDRSDIELASLSKWATTNGLIVTGRVLVVNIENPKNMTKANLDNLTVDKINQWKLNNLDNPNHFQIRRGENWEQILKNEDMIIVTNK